MSLCEKCQVTHAFYEEENAALEARVLELESQALLDMKEINEVLARSKEMEGIAGKLAKAMKSLMEPAQFGSNEQSPPGCWDDEIEIARVTLAEFDDREKRGEAIGVDDGE